MAVNPPVNGRQTSVPSVCSGVAGAGVWRRWLPDQTQLDLFQSGRASPAGERERAETVYWEEASPRPAAADSIFFFFFLFRCCGYARSPPAEMEESSSSSHKRSSAGEASVTLPVTSPRRAPAYNQTPWRNVLSCCFQRVSNERNNQRCVHVIKQTWRNIWICNEAEEKGEAFKGLRVSAPRTAH